MNNFRIHTGAVKIAAAFLIIGLLGIFLADKVIQSQFINSESHRNLHLYFDLVLILIAGGTILLLINRQIDKKNKIIDSVKLQNEYQRLLIQNLPDTDVFLLDSGFNLIFNAGAAAGASLMKVLETELKQPDPYCADGKSSKRLIDHLPFVKDGKRINLAVDLGDGLHEIHGIPIYDQNIVDGILLIIFNRSAQRDLIRQVTAEKQSFAKLSNRYHKLNKELEESYAQMKTYNDELLENKERYGTFIQQTSEAVYRFDLKKPIDQNLPTDPQIAGIVSSGYLAEYNRAFAHFYDLDNESNYIGKSQHEIFNRRNQSQYQELMRMLIQHEYQLKDFETIEYDAQGRARYFINNVVGIVENNKLIRFWGTKHETTRQKKYERDLISAKKTAEQSNRLKSAFLANMSHEIRTPLNGILGFSELLIKPGIDGEKRNKYYNIIHSSSQQLLRIINDILDISRIQTGELSITKTEFGVNTLLSEIEAALLNDIEQKRNKVTFEIKHALPKGKDRIYTDRDRLYQIISNLANNALKFTHEGSILVSYEIKTNSLIEFSVSDTGIGIPDEYLGDIFDQFRQVEEFSSRKYGGTGLGLSICKGLTQLLGGYIAVESEEGVGSTFRFTIKTN